jgi:hypothetical protein
MNVKAQHAIARRVKQQQIAAGIDIHAGDAKFS